MTLEDSTPESELSEYALIDSGDGGRLERFGDVVLSRPSTTAIWKRRASREIWLGATAEFDHQKGWRFLGEKIDEWEISISGITLVLRLQNNGQIGFFPEHALYLPELKAALMNSTKKREVGGKLSVLNLFAYTGLASVFMASANTGNGEIEVTHVDISKKALEWARLNSEANQCGNAIRFIAEDALSFMEREIRRGRKYDLILADPPSFSRIDKRKSWDLSDKLSELAGLLTQLAQENGAIFCAHHAGEQEAYALANLLGDADPFKRKFVVNSLVLMEGGAGRLLPAGHLLSS